MDLKKIAARVASDKDLAPFEKRHREAVDAVYQGMEAYSELYAELANLPAVRGSSKARDYVHSTMNHVSELKREVKDWGDDFRVLAKEMAEQDPPEEDYGD